MIQLELENALGAVYKKGEELDALNTPFYQSAGVLQSMIGGSKEVAEFVEELVKYIEEILKENK